MQLRNLTFGLLLTVMLAVTACGAQQEGDGAATPKQSTINGFIAFEGVGGV
ncbi:hypothetical protein [Streptomyces mirabilis]|uniref:hypothetical protein n=1 Tax=Streptomyces mirabilis TaxID=68239 RepID=UPI0036C5CC67